MALQRFLFIFCVGLGLWSCEKDITGPKGDKGVEGAGGEVGGDYVLYTSVFNVDSLDWQLTGSAQRKDEYYYLHSDVFLSSDVIDKSLILLYIVEDDGKFSLPYWVGSTDEFIEFTYKIRNGGIELFYKNLGGNILLPGDRKFELVVLNED